MNPITVCTVVFNRYDMLHNLMVSLQDSTLRPERVIVIDHGYDEPQALAAVTGVIPEPVEVVTLADPGMAHAINWFIQNVDDDRVICNDDIQFRPDVLEKLADTQGDLVAPYGRLRTAKEERGFHPFSCFILRDSGVDQVGLWDETISPRYLYFDDCDYWQRMKLAGVSITEVDCRVFHDRGSASYCAYTEDQMRDHHRKFALAEQNFIAKWGQPPSPDWEREYRRTSHAEPAMRA